MSLISPSPGEAQLAELIDHFEHRRKSRTTRGEPIPDALWEQAVSLTRLLPLSRVAKRLRLNRQELKKRCGQRQPQPPATPDRWPGPDFMGIFLAIDPVDFRKGIDGLAALCRRALGANPLEDAVYVFRNRSGTALKILFYDGQGFWLMMKRLSQGRFHWWPSGPDAASVLSARELAIV